MTDSQEFASLRRRTIISTFSLFFQSGYAAGLGLVANLILTILLSPTVFGIYITVLSVIALLNYFSDFGLAASLIQKKEVTNTDLKTVFTAQQLIIVMLLIVGYVATPIITSFYHLPQEGIFLYWALLVGFFVSSLKTIPSILLERKIKFQKIVLVQIVENTAFYVCVVTLAFLHFGLMSFTYAVLLRSIVGLILIYSLSFWKPSFQLSIASLRELLAFGIPLQASSFLAIFKDDLIILYLGRLVGFEALGYIGWAKKWAEAFIRIVMDNVNRVVFPFIARFQDNKEIVRTMSEKILYYQTFVLAPALLGVCLIMGNLIEVIPNYQKWQPALPAFYIFSLSSIIISFAAPFVTILNALGRVKTTFIFMLGYTTLTWILTPYFVASFGFLGFPFAHLLVSTSFLLVTRRAQSLIHFQFIRPIYKFIIAALGMGIVLLLSEQVLIQNALLRIPFLIGTGALMYFLILKIVFRINFIEEFRQFHEKKPLDN